MDTYSLMREFADSWALLALFIIFILVVLWAFRPGSRKLHDEIADTVFRNEDKPLPIDPLPIDPLPIDDKPAPIVAKDKEA
jgi:cytochrome c oxidase cbb3-type subunit IV